MVLDECYGSQSPLWVCTLVLLVYHLERKSGMEFEVYASPRSICKQARRRKWSHNEQDLVRLGVDADTGENVFFGSLRPGFFFFFFRRRPSPWRSLVKQLLRRSFILLFGGCGCELIHFTLGETGIIYFRRKGMGISRKRRSLAEG